jgi:D-sedoheptulose 7-phosphate isomerase
MTSVREAIERSVETKQRILSDDELIARCDDLAAMIVRAYRANGKVLLCGNGGSAADAQHIAAELSGRFAFDRPPLYAEALHVNSSYLTAVANDYGYDVVFSRMIEAVGRPGDVFVGLSTSGNSVNVVRGAEEARRLGMSVVAMTGDGGGKLGANSDLLIAVPSRDTARIQECHITIGHAVCGLVERVLFPSALPA